MGIKGEGGGGDTKSKAMFRSVGSGHPRGGVTNFCIIIEKKHSIKIKPLPRNFKLMASVKFRGFDKKLSGRC